MKVTKSTSRFTQFAKWTSHVSGSPPAFALAIGIVVTWGITGPLFGYSDTGNS
jgi:low affinity Fe/Cu permease